VAKKTTGFRRWLAITLQAIIFSVAHLGYSRLWLDFGALFVAGLILGELRRRGVGIIFPDANLHEL